MSGQRRTMHRGSGVALLLLAAAVGAREGRAQDAAAAKQQVDEILRDGLSYAKTQIEQEFSFLPFAVIRHADGRIERILGPTGDELDPLDTPELQAHPERALEQLQRRVQQQAKARGDFQVVGIFSDAEVKLPDGADSDAIQAVFDELAQALAARERERDGFARP